MEAVIQPFKLSEVQQSLMDVGVGGITVTEVKGHGAREEAGMFYRGKVDNSWPAAKIMIEVVVGDRDLQEVVNVLCRAARTGRIGDGMVFITPVEEAIRIRNDQRNEAAV